MCDVQTVAALAVAEAAVEFEHRDLHWGNLLIRRVPVSHRISCRLRCALGCRTHQCGKQELWTA